MGFKYSVKLNTYKDKIWVRELPGHLYRDLVKSLYNNDDVSFLQHIGYVIEHIYPGIFQENLNIIDKLLLLLNMRSICISPDLNLKAECPVTKKKFETTIKIEDLIVKLESLSFTKTIEAGKFRVTHSIVKARDEEHFVNITQDQKFTRLIASCVDTIDIPDTAGIRTGTFNGLDFGKRLSFVEKLPITITKQIFESIIETDNELSKSKILSVGSPYAPGTKIVDLPVSFDCKVCLEFCKLLFNDDLANLYKLMFNLVSKAGFSPEYVDNISPAEQLLYWNYYLQQAQKEKEEVEKTSNNSPSFGGLKLPHGKESPSEFA